MSRTDSNRTGAETTGQGLDASQIDGWLSEIGERVAAVRERLRDAGGSEVTLLAVSKAKPAEAVAAAVALGLGPLGENYAQELVGKDRALAAGGIERPDWHFIGQLQANKVRLLAGTVAVWQSVDRNKLGTEIAKRDPGARVFAQVNLSDDPGKAGCSFDALDGLVEHLLGCDLRVEGLMGVGTAADEAATRQGFALLRAAVDRHGLAQCSMGMTGDLELAVAEGSTMVRVGTALFGARS